MWVRFKKALSTIGFEGKRQGKIIEFYILQILILTLLITLATFIGYFFRSMGFPETNIVLVYLLVVLITACISKGYVMGIIASVCATLAFNYFFTVPNWSLSVEDPSYIITFVIMTSTAFIASTLTYQVKQSALEALDKEAQAKALYSLTNQLTDSKDLNSIISIAVHSISECFSLHAACLYFEEKDVTPSIFIQQTDFDQQIHRSFPLTSEIKKKMGNLRTSYSVGSEFWDWPIYGGEMLLGVIRIPYESAVTLSEAQIKLLQSMIESSALAMDRLRFVTQQMKAREETAQERYRANILRAISHDLRTPLSGIIGTSEMLLDMTQESDPRYAMADGIHKEADWLYSLVENILSLTRLQDSSISLHKQSEAVEEVVGGALAHLHKRYPQRNVCVQVPEEVFMVPMDAKLIEQVILNLLDNAVKHTP
ncbi:MAG: DUF4118 domain-containing protein, partial [Oscillospiraceae bacterium]